MAMKRKDNKVESISKARVRNGLVLKETEGNVNTRSNKCFIAWGTFLFCYLSLMIITPLALAVEPDSYEVDDTFNQANVIVLNNDPPQQHNFHDARDQDWVKLYGISSETTTRDFELTGDDSDGDGHPDNSDAFPNAPDERLDTDGDETGNNADTDDDNDGMPDAWEEDYGLNPLVDDSSEDMDADAISNIDEYLAGTDPTQSSVNNSPDQPVLSLPTGSLTNVSLTPELQIEAFSDPDGDTHAETQWQISTDTSFSSEFVVLDVTSDSLLTSLTVPEFILSGNTTYYWRVKFHDNRDAASGLSDVFSFTTITSDETDSNEDGIPDDQEVDETVDLDNNGTPDIDQSDIKCVNTVVGDGQIGVKEDTNVTSIESIKSIDPDDISDTENKPDEMPLGLISFRLKVDNAGDTAKVTVYLSEPAPRWAKWYKYHPINGWQDYSEHAIFSEDGKSVTVELKDGSYGDADGKANGFIVDPSGLGTGNQVPMASFMANPTSGEAPLTVSFDASASNDPDGTVDFYAWAFGDGSTVSGATTSREYVSAGTYPVALTVTDDDGSTDTATATITVTATASSSRGGGSGGGCFIATAAY